MKDRNWIFRTLYVVGLVITITLVVFYSNLVFKNSDFTTDVGFTSPYEGDAGALLLKRNEQTPSVLDWVSFEENGEQFFFFSDSTVHENIFVDLPEKVEPGVYYFDVEVIYVSGSRTISTMSFRVI